ncbi:MAG: hypothetical protein ACREJO_03575 [Phycisphaerales bacterium]
MTAATTSIHSLIDGAQECRTEAAALAAIAADRSLRAVRIFGAIYLIPAEHRHVLASTGQPFCYLFACPRVPGAVTVPIN